MKIPMPVVTLIMLLIIGSAMSAACHYDAAAFDAMKLGYYNALSVMSGILTFLLVGVVLPAVIIALLCGLFSMFRRKKRAHTKKGP